jgi:uncharacterized membrane protein (DUF2068 family)
MDRTRGAANRYELFTCAWSGHVLVGVDAASVAGADPAFVREFGATRWYRCLRCDDWVQREPPAEAGASTVPRRDQVELPLRGPALRDRYILRLIAFDRLIHVAVLSVLAIVIFLFLGHRRALQSDYDQIMSGLTGGPGGTDDLHGFLTHFRHWFFISPAHLYEVGVAALAYATLEATEMVGLWYAKRWAEYLTFVATVVFIPLEVYELTRSVTTLRVVILIINVAIMLYLLFAKRLFGVRGGHKVVVAQREAEGGWAAVDAATFEGRVGAEGG